MELSLTRSDYLQVGVTSPKTLKLLPSGGKRSTQKVGLYALIEHWNCIVFKTLPSSAISRLSLGGFQGPAQDRIFVASGAEVKGFSKKGKQFLGFDTNLTESIQAM
ncbi:predicted protein [Nematostella vectensis]|uniref:BBS7 beta-propeller domain-containing protein n=1 Tax=Nematostella vectensis TaxID=45351 RepID=A7T6T2_NEMVE|nr:predicted protein [Nematostella vectensis]|eukprot:XP_001620424.1 hypothetical protein NEMVEDRAFT_v1g148193 [Nematostella vectensis]